MSKCLITGVAGFIGSHLAEALLHNGHHVIGIDCFNPYYARVLKEDNLRKLREHPSFVFHEGDLRKMPLQEITNGCDCIFHLAAMAGLMLSWQELELYASCNILGTQRILEFAHDIRVPHFIHISTSSVYGREAQGPENSTLLPCSPYGITKLAAEHLCRSYADLYQLPLTILRYFSVYGPRQRPDMAYNILIKSLLEQKPFTIYGDGEQTRSNTYIADCVQATILAFKNRDKAVGEIFNVGGGEVVSLNKAIAILEELTGKSANIIRQTSRPGDQRHTAANIEKICKILGYKPSTPVRTGLQAQVVWQSEIMSRSN